MRLIINYKDKQFNVLLDENDTIQMLKKQIEV